MTSQRFPAFKCREGRIVFWAVSIYFMIWFAIDFGKLRSPLPSFVTLMSGYMPFVLLLFFYQLGGFRRDFKTGWFNTAVLLGVALMPFLVWASSLVSM